MFCPKESLSLKFGYWFILLEDWGVCTGVAPGRVPMAGLS